ncbi:hypothetical protein AKJ41_03000 [candidate division MSBL1 archaeon SCGC-AAA259O05]|uniref:Zinc ribbon domain-containing protein n=1 Tax=candidate division MSBL1 archaeon SCGC-AAA259O05 TaxID=1698271 RepID=A0A133V3P1_9EURY|nr:hypothetical protein AKJ41_03000 [candidate division MSBL1 archaeon SCGC-AAA259O05]
MSSSPPTLVEIEVDIQEGKVRGKLTPESEEKVLKNSLAGSESQFTRSCSFPFSGLRESLSEAVAKTMLKFNREFEEVGFSFSANLFGERLSLLDGERVSSLLEKFEADAGSEMRSCPDCGRLYSEQVTVCPDCGCNLYQEEEPDE